MELDQLIIILLTPERLLDLTEGQVLRQAYQAFWKRDLVSAQKLFRHVAAMRAYRMHDLGHVVMALLPLRLYRGLLRLADRKQE